MNVLICVPTSLPCSSTPYSAGAVLEIPNEWYQPLTMTRLGTVHPLLAGRIALSTLVPGMPPVAAN